MARIRQTHTTFNTGLINKKVQALIDFDMYNNSLSECKNFVIQPTGGAFKRGGSKFVADITALNIPKEQEQILSLSFGYGNEYILIPSQDNYGATILNVYSANGLVTRLNTQNNSEESWKRVGISIRVSVPKLDDILFTFVNDNTTLYAFAYCSTGGGVEYVRFMYAMSPSPFNEFVFHNVEITLIHYDVTSVYAITSGRLSGDHNNILVCIFNNGYSTHIKSTEIWSLAINKNPVNIVNFEHQAVHDITYINDLDKYVAVGGKYMNDGSKDTFETQGFVLVGIPAKVTSEINWQSYDIAETKNLTKVRCTNNIIFAVAADVFREEDAPPSGLNPTYAFSVDGSVWRKERCYVLYNENFYDFVIRDVVYFKEQYFFVGNTVSGVRLTVAYSKHPLFDWTGVDTGFQSTLTQIDIVNNTLIAIGENKLIIESADGIVWKVSNFNSNSSKGDVVYRLVTKESIALISTNVMEIHSPKYGNSTEVTGIWKKGTIHFDNTNTFQAIQTGDKVLLLWKDTLPIEISKTGDQFSANMLNFSTTPMSFQDTSMTLYPNFVVPSSFQEATIIEISKYKSLTPFMLPSCRTLRFEGDYVGVNETCIFPDWNNNIQYPWLPSQEDDGVLVCLSYQVPGDKIKYENWWFKIKSFLYADAPVTNNKNWYFHNANESITPVLPPGDPILAGFNNTSKSFVVLALTERNPKGADGKPQNIPWWTEASKYIDKANAQDQSKMVAIPYNWYVSACSPRRGYFTAYAVHEGRLWVANTTQYPNCVWGSSITNNDWLDFTTGIDPGDAIQLKMYLDHSDEILWMAAQTKLFVGTHSGIHVLGSASFNDEAITPANARFREISAIPAAPILPVKGLDAIFFVSAYLDNVYEIIVLDTGMYKINNLSLLSNEYLSSGIISHTFLSTPSTCYCLSLSDGRMAFLTYQKPNNVMAWSIQELGNVIPGRAYVKRVATEYKITGDRLWMIVERELYEDETKTKLKKIRTLEYIEQTNAIDSNRDEEQYYVDCGVDKQISANITNITTTNNPMYNFDEKLSELILDDSSYFCLIDVSGHSPIDLLDRNCFLKALPNKDGQYIGALRLRKCYKDKDYKIDLLPGDLTNRVIYFMFQGTVTEIGEDYLVFNHEKYEPSSKILFFQTNTELDQGRYYLVPFPSEAHKYQVLNTVKPIPINFYGLKITEPERLKYCFISLLSEFSDDYVTSYSPPAAVTIDGELPVVDTFVKVQGLSSMKELNDKDYIVQSVSEQTHTIRLREKIDYLSTDEYVTASLDTTIYTASETNMKSGKLYTYFTEVSGLNHLAGQEVYYLSDGNRGSSPLTVDENGNVQLPVPATYAAVGCKIESILETVPLYGGSLIGSSVGAVGRQNDSVVQLYRSLGGQVGESAERVHDIQYRRANGALVDQPQKLYTGLIRQSLEHSNDTLERKVYIKHDDTTAFNILSITQDASVVDGAP
ncbi:MAG: hypothetical protein LBJ80_00105 [Rickettsiales bacterium]|jgi:hypothetical protein|nr:hypothetical protein [Rickettsiales bacterium]